MIRSEKLSRIFEHEFEMWPKEIHRLTDCQTHEEEFAEVDNDNIHISHE